MINKPTRDSDFGSLKPLRNVKSQKNL